MSSPSVTYTFSNGVLTDATQVNQNFTDLLNAMTDGSKSFAIDALTCASTLGLAGNFAIATNKFTVAASTGNTVVGGTLSVTGTSTFTGAATFTGGVTFNGGITLGDGDDLIGSATSDITFNTDKFTVAGATGNTVIAGTLDVTGVGTFTAQSIHNAGITDGTATLDGSGAWTGITSLTVDNIVINGNDISTTAGTDLTITPLAGQQIVLDGTIVVDAGVVTGATSITSTAFVGTLSTAAQTNITSLGTLTTLTVDNITINGSTISHATATDLVITATAGNAVAIEGVTFDGNAVAAISTLAMTGNMTLSNNSAVITHSGTTSLTVTSTSGTVIVEGITFTGDAITGASNITSTAFTGNLTGNCSGTAATVTGAAQANITSLGTLTTLTVDNININGSTITGMSDANTVITAYTGKAIAIEGVSFDGGAVSGITTLGCGAITSTGAFSATTGAFSGNLGVGIAAAAAGSQQLYVYNNVINRSSFAIIENAYNTAGFSSELDLKNDTGKLTKLLHYTSGGAYTYMGLPTADSGGLISNATNGLMISTNAATSMYFGTNSTLRMTINSSGNVGIGTATFGTSAAGVLTIANGTQGAALANTVQIVSSDLTAGVTSLNVRTEGSSSVQGTGDNTSDGFIAITWNGAIHYILTKSTQPS